MNIKYEKFCHYSSEKDWEKKWRPEEKSVGEWVESCLYRSVDNQLTSASINAESAQAAIGRLVEVLAQRGILSVDDIVVVAGKDKETSRWSDDWERTSRNHELVP